MRDYCDGSGVGEAYVRVTKVISVYIVKGFYYLLFQGLIGILHIVDHV